ncbi:MAG: twin-arginine translocase TatA/TatE family subunit [Muribaculaceae bacterium]|nr:twin-arginine translocase TatA/TatE family subunit [Muribaculaceae bacterium]
MLQYNLSLFLGGIRGWEWIIIVLVILLLFGGKKIPELMRGVGKGIRGFKEGLEDVKDEINRPASTKDPDESDKK